MANIDTAFRIEKLSIEDKILIAEGEDDPSTGVGYEAPVGSLYIQSGTEHLYVKHGSNDTDWRRVTGIDSKQAFEVMKEPTGHLNRVDSSISFDEATRIFSIQPRVPAVSFDYYIKGFKYTIDVTKTIQLPNTTGLYFIYFDDNKQLQYQTSFDITLLTEKVLTAIIYWNATSSEAPYFADERHGLIMDGMTHLHFHLSLGSRYVNGLGLYNFNINQQPPTDDAVKFAVQNGLFRDEDLDHSIYHTGNKVNPYDLEQNLTPYAEIPILYRLGTQGEWNIKTANQYPILESGVEGYIGANGRPAWNQWTGTTWTLTEVGNNRTFLMHYFAVNDPRHPIVGVLGINQYQNISQERKLAELELKQIQGLPFAEFVPLGSVLFEVSNTFTNSVKARIITASDGQHYIDWRTSSAFTLLGGVSIQNTFDRFSDGTNTAIASSPTDTFTFIGGTGINVFVDPDNDTLTITNTFSESNSFGIIAVPSQNSIVADSPTDTLTLTSDSNIIITTDSNTDTINFATSHDLGVMQTEIDNIETSTGLNQDGTFNPSVYQNTNFIINPTSVYNAIIQLDNAIFQNIGPDKILSRHNGNISQTFNTTLTTLLFDTSLRTDSIYTYDNGVITINENGYYLISFEISYYSTTNAVTSCQTSLYLNNNLVNGSNAYSYHSSTNSGQQTTTSTVILQITQNDQISVRAVRTTGNGSLVTLTNSCRLNIKKLR